MRWLGPLAGLLLGFLSGLLMFKRSLRWCRVCGETMTCPRCVPSGRYSAVARAREDFALHIPGLFTKNCLAEGCEEWPCPPYRRAVPVLERAGEIDVAGQLRVR